MQWIGPVSGEEKAALLAGARALLFPVLWPEPFGLAVVEALVSGTPVIGSRKGSLPELVPPDVGQLLDPQDEDGWASALAGRWDPERCRAWAIGRFHYSKMAENYEKQYRKVLAGEVLNPQEPLGHDWRKQP
jgi:glycosyltransferase involved in cell wall biosynthesis